MCGKTMHIAFIGPGILPIPPNGWGAVELLVWEYAKELGELGHSGTIINTPDHDQIIRTSPWSHNWITQGNGIVPVELFDSSRHLREKLIAMAAQHPAGPLLTLWLRASAH